MESIWEVLRTNEAASGLLCGLVCDGHGGRGHHGRGHGHGRGRGHGHGGRHNGNAHWCFGGLEPSPIFMDQSSSIGQYLGVCGRRHVHGSGLRTLPGSLSQLANPQ